MFDIAYVADYGMPYLFAIYIGLVLIMAFVAVLSNRTVPAED